MEKVIICLRDGSNGFLESPTGTGKTLCSSLEWLQSRKEEMKMQIQQTAPPPIILKIILFRRSTCK
ncbi:regulator of telomere elongation helicase 1 homolog [Haematobia irritans]|uniref:regulator of telomere elongation helicase 1 homolog n=1 Tax=Haematobia irritans TaxID=7368 RepID=UPI003F4FA8A5